jgi:hypothetical protein
MSEQREWKVGDTTIRFEPPDLEVDPGHHRHWSAVAAPGRGRTNESALTKVRFASSQAEARELISRMRAERLAKAG